jgi:MscS family membrane protein
VAQIPGLSKAPSPAAQDTVTDPLGRITPRRAIAAFIRAVDRGDFVSAARYMQVTGSQRRNSDTLARDLKALMDRYFSQAVTSISDSPDGALDDGLPIERERVGPLTMGEKRTDIALVRVTDPQFGRIWLIGDARGFALRASIPSTFIERVMPEPLLRRTLFGVPVAYWIVLAASLVVPFITLALLSGALAYLVRRLPGDPARRGGVKAWYDRLRWPAIAALSLAIQLSSIPSLGFPLTFRIAYARVGLVLFVIALTWFLRRLLTLGFARARGMVWGEDRTKTQSLLLLGERLLKAFVILVAVFAILTIVGVDTRTALAGVGIGGVALALGAQKTVENFLGGVFLLSDRALAVGDMVSISNRLGRVEDITLRSVRLRTLDRTMVSVPAGVLAQAGIENFATREQILVQTTLRLRYGTSVEQLRRILDGIRRLLAEDSRIEKGTSRIRLVNFSDRAIELELFAYVLTADVPEFLAVREELLLEVAAIVEAAGSGFAQPTQFIYTDTRAGVGAPARAVTAHDTDTRTDVQLTRPIGDRPADRP